MTEGVASLVRSVRIGAVATAVLLGGPVVWFVALALFATLPTRAPSLARRLRSARTAAEFIEGL